MKKKIILTKITESRVNEIIRHGTDIIRGKGIDSRLKDIVAIHTAKLKELFK